MPERYPGYDVLHKRNSPSWNEQTRKVIDKRLAIDPDRRFFFTEDEWPTLRAICDRIIPQKIVRPRRVPLAAMVDDKMFKNAGDGYRYTELPPMRDAWRLGLEAIDAEAKGMHGLRFHELDPLQQDTLLTAVQQGEVRDRAWRKIPPKSFFKKRLLHDIVSAYYADPQSWNEIGFGGPASPRGYVRMNFNRRDPWEASEARPGRERRARQENERVG